MKSVKKRRHRQQFFKGILYKNLLYEKFQSSKENPVFTSLLVLVKCDLKKSCPYMVRSIYCCYIHHPSKL